MEKYANFYRILFKQVCFNSESVMHPEAIITVSSIKKTEKLSRMSMSREILPAHKFQVYQLLIDN